MNLFKAALLAAAMTLALPSAASLAATPADVLVVAQNIDDIVSIDPAEAYEFSSGEYVTQTYDRLVQYDAPDVKTLVAGLATEWKADDANKTITFTLRDGVKFSSGNPLRAEDVVYSWKRVVVLNKSPAFLLTQLGWTPENIETMVKADGNKVVVKYAGDFSSAFVLNVLAARPASVVDAVTVQANEANGDMGNAWLKANSAGTGAFILKAYRPAEIINLVWPRAVFSEWYLNWGSLIMTGVLGLLGALIVWRTFRRGAPAGGTESRAAVVAEADDA